MHINGMNGLPFLASFKDMKNPQEVVMNMLQERANQSPIFSNLLDLVQKGDTQGVENVVRNIAREKGIDFDKEFEELEVQILELEEEKSTLEEKLSGGNSGTDFSDIAEITKQYQDVSDSLEKKYERWEELASIE